MKILKFSEIFYSLQGEGLYTGTPSVFLRTFGCNFRCQGFGMSEGELSNEYQKIEVSKFEKLEDLPLVKTGCDSYASWDPRCKKFTQTATVNQLVSLILKLTPEYSFLNNDFSQIHLVITGGEPLLGWQKFYPDLLRELHYYGLEELTFETNGTQHLTNEMYMLFRPSDEEDVVSRLGLNVTFMVSPKLPCSGEKWEAAIQPEVVRKYSEVGNVALKFVVSTDEDIEFVEKALLEYNEECFEYQVYLMPVGGVKETYHENMRFVAEKCLEKGWRYSPRLHCDIFGNKWGA